MREFVPPTPRKAMTDKRRAQAFLMAGGKCHRCNCRIRNGEFEVDHDISLYSGGADDETNCVVLCIPCHKGEKTPADAKKHAKIDRLHRKAAGLKPRKGRSLSHPTLRKKMNGEVVAR